MNLTQAIQTINQKNNNVLTDENLFRSYLYDYCGSSFIDRKQATLLALVNSKISLIKDILMFGDKNYINNIKKSFLFKNVMISEYEDVVNKTYEAFGFYVVVNNFKNNKQINQKNINNNLIKNVKQNANLKVKNNVKAKPFVANKVNPVYKKPMPLKTLKGYWLPCKIRWWIIYTIILGSLVCLNEFGILKGISCLSYNSKLGIGLSVLSVILMSAMAFLFIIFGNMFYFLSIEDLFENKVNLSTFQLKLIPKMFPTYFMIRMIVFLSQNKIIFNEHYIPLLLLVIFQSLIIIGYGLFKTILDLKIKLKYQYYLFDNCPPLLFIINTILVITLTSLVPVWVCYIVSFVSIGSLIFFLIDELKSSTW